jgi:gas vesicle protein
MPESKSRSFLKGLFIGGLIGAAGGILFAPKSGMESREDIGRKTRETFTKTKEAYEAALEKSRKAYEAGVEKMKDVQAAARKKGAEAEEKVEEWAIKGKETLKDTKGRVKKAIDAGIEAYKTEEKEKD